MKERGMRREGSPWQGLGVVILKERSDHLSSWRMRILEWLVVVVAAGTVYAAIQAIKEVTAGDPFSFPPPFTPARGPPPPLALASLPAARGSIPRSAML